jgi:adenosylcobinamide-phosphate synthase
VSALALTSGYLADVAFGDPRRLHPVAGFGQVAARVEARTYVPSRLRGTLFAGALVGGAGVLAEFAARRGPRPVVLSVVVWAALGGRSLTRVASRLADEVAVGDLDAARATLPWLCGRDPAGLDGAALARAALESVAENTSDAVVGALFWGAVAGPGGVVAYRAANTLDAMVGHRSMRYREFGWAAARLDDALNWAPARLTAALTVVCAPVVGGAPDTTLEVVLRDGARHPSPNAGRVEAAFAGALGVTLGGPLTYAGVAELRPTMGKGPAPAAADVHRASRLSLAVGAAATVVCAGLSILRRRKVVG